MRYTIFSHLYFPHTGGVESFTHNLSHELVRSGSEVLVVTMRTDNSPEYEKQKDGVGVMRLPCHSLMSGRLPWTRHSSAYRALFKQALAWKADRVLVNTRFYPHSVEGLKYANKLDVPAVLLDHGSAYLTVGASGIDKILAAYEHAITAIDKLYRPTFAGISARSAEWLETFNIDTKIVIPNAIDADEFRSSASQRDFRKELGIDQADMLVVSVGRLEPEKGGLQLAKAARHFECEQRAVHFAIAGEGSLRGQLTAVAGKNFHLLGNISSADLARLLLCADVFCLPSRSEGFCTSLLEASACSLPSIVTDVGGARELIPSREYGWILSGHSAESIVQAVSLAINLPRTELRSMGERNYQLVNSLYTWKNTTLLLENAYSR